MTYLWLLFLAWHPRQGHGFAAGEAAPFQDRRIRESSGVVASRKYPGRLWTINDSGNDPLLFLTDTTGARLGAFRVTGASNQDWEALGRGPCPGGECLYIGDTGDNGERRRSVTLYRVPEPAPGSGGDAFAGGAEALQVSYPDRPHDVEGLYVEPDGAVVLVTKGRKGGVLSFRVGPDAWNRPGPARAERLDSLPITAQLSSGDVVTDAAISLDGSRVVLRTYRELWFFRRGRDGHLTLDPDRPVCNAVRPQRLGEAVDWWSGDRLVLTSERGLYDAGTVVLGRCPAR